MNSTEHVRIGGLLVRYARRGSRCSGSGVCLSLSHRRLSSEHVRGAPIAIELGVSLRHLLHLLQTFGNLLWCHCWLLLRSHRQTRDTIRLLTGTRGNHLLPHALQQVRLLRQRGLLLRLRAKLLQGGRRWLGCLRAIGQLPVR